jgi:hypothetical protein
LTQEHIPLFYITPNLNYDELTALPLPLHLAKQLKEYTLPLPEEDEE